MKFNNSLVIIVFLFAANIIFSQTFDEKYSSEYVLKKSDGTEVSRLKHYRSGNKLKFTKVENKGTEKETTTDIYILKDERMIYQVTSGTQGKIGFKKPLDFMYVGMLTGIYILDLGNDGSVFNSSYLNGSGEVLGKTCDKYTIITQGDASSDYYMYQNNLMLKRWVGSPTEGGNSIEAISYDTPGEMNEGMFVLPADITYLDM